MNSSNKPSYGDQIESMGYDHEKAIKAWLKLRLDQKMTMVEIGSRDVVFYLLNAIDGKQIAQITLSSTLSKRYPRRKKVKK